MVLHFVTASDHVDRSVTEEGFITVAPWELLVAEVHVGVDGVGWVAVFDCGKAIDDPDGYSCTACH